MSQPTPQTGHLDDVYLRRYGEDAATREPVWREIVGYLQRWFPEDGAVLDVACDNGVFIRHVRARERWATDIRDMAAALPPDVHFVQADGLALDEHVPLDHFDRVFMSNYLEHLDSGASVVRQLEVVRRILRPGGRVVVLQPNIRLIGGRYWDFIDHNVAITDQSLAEAAELAGLTVVKLVTRFLPYSTKSRLPQHPLLVRAYLRFPPAWWLLGRQTLLVAER